MSAPPALTLPDPSAPVHGPCVSVIVPCRNERAYIAPFCRNALHQRVPQGWSIEVLVADGMSDDGTREVLQQLCLEDNRLRWVDNPRQTASAGLNATLRVARGTVILRMDVHTEYAPDYLQQALSVLEQTGADNVGGPWLAQAHSHAGPMQHAIAAAFQCAWVAGGALSRRLDYNGWTDTVYLGCWPRASFERFGLFDEALVRNQDDEHNLRLIKAGGRVWQSSHIRSTYRPRSTLGQVFRQYLQYGYWKPFVITKHGQTARLRHAVPALLVSAGGLSLLLACLGLVWPAAVVSAAYAGVVLLMTLAVARQSSCKLPSLCLVPLVVATFHGAYGVGFMMGLWDALRGGKGRQRFAALSR